MAPPTKSRLEWSNTSADPQDIGRLLLFLAPGIEVGTPAASAPPRSVQNIYAGEEGQVPDRYKG